MMSEDLKIQTSALAEYVCDGNEALEFKLVKTAGDIDNQDVGFPPEMCHQIYGDNENIFGYKGLKVITGDPNGRSHESLLFPGETVHVGRQPPGLRDT